MDRDHCHENIRHFEQHHYESNNHISLPLNLLTIHNDHCDSNRSVSIREQFRGEEVCHSRTEAKLFGIIPIFEQERTSIRIDDCNPRRWEYERPHAWLNDRYSDRGGCFPQPIFVPEIRACGPVYGYMPVPQYIPVGPMYTFNRCPNQPQGIPPGYFEESAQPGYSSGYSPSENLPPGYSRPVYSDMGTPYYYDRTPTSDGPERPQPNLEESRPSAQTNPNSPQDLAPEASNSAAMLPEEDMPMAEAIRKMARTSPDQTPQNESPEQSASPLRTAPSEQTAPQNGPTQEDLSKEVDPDPARQAFFDKNLPDIGAPPGAKSDTVQPENQSDEQSGDQPMAPSNND